MYPHQDLTHKIISAAIEVHKNLGPGLLETVYSHCLGLELELRGLRFQKELNVPLYYKNRKIDRFLRFDFLVENEIVLDRFGQYQLGYKKKFGKHREDRVTEYTERCQLIC